MGRGYDRALACVLALTLLWCTSLSVCVVVASHLFRLVPLGTIATSCAESMATVQHQRDRYASCVDNELEVCSEALKADVLEEKGRVRAVHEANNGAVREQEKDLASCLVLEESVRDTLTRWVEGSLGNDILFNHNASQRSVDAVWRLVGRAEEVRKASGASSLSSSFSDASLSRVDRLVDYSDELQAYNTWYVHNKTGELQAASAELTASLAAVGAALGTDLNIIVAALAEQIDETLDATHASVEGVYVGIKSGVDANLNLARVTMDEMDGTARALWADAQHAMARADAFFATVAGGAGVAKSLKERVEDALADVGVSLDLCSLGSWCTFGPADWAIAEPAFVDVPLLFDPISVDSFTEQMQIPFDTARAELYLAAAPLRSFPNQVALSVGGVPAVYVAMGSDYHPPTYSHASNSSGEVRQQEEASGSFLADLETLLLSNQSAVGQAAATAEAAARNVSDWGHNASLSSAAYPSSWNLLSQKWLPHLDLATLRSTFGSLQKAIYVADTAYRVCQSLLLVRKHWRGAAAALPPVQLKPLGIGTKGSGMNSVIQFVQVSPALSTYLALGAVLCLLVVSALLRLYMPMFDTYSSVCANGSYMDTVQGEWTISTTNTTSESDITVTGLSSVLYHSSVDLARSSGQQRLSRGITAHELAASEHCSVMTQEYGVREYWSLETHSNDVTRQHMQCTGGLDTVHSAVNLTAMDSAFSAGAVLPALTDRVWPGAVAYDPGELTPSAWDCEALSPCTSTCDGPDEQSLFRGASHCACLGEWRVHGVVVQAAFAVFIFISINASRVLLCRGIFTILWRKLKSERLAVAGECDHDGRLLLGDEDTATEDTVEEEVALGHAMKRDRTTEVLRQRVKSLARNTVTMGWLYVAMAIALNLPWLLLLQTATDSLQYNIAG